MRKKPLVKKLNKPREYRTPKTISWERAAEFYGDQPMSLCTSNVVDKPINLRTENVLAALKQAKKRDAI